MYFKQFYLGCLAHASYLIGSDGEAAVIDPQRDVDLYLREAKEKGLRIRYVIETHLHADFVSGHRELAERTGAEIVFGWRANASFNHRPVRDGDELKLGALTLRILETPGHTPESISILAEGKLFTGDTLFIGDVGRPDLAGSKGYTPEQMAEMLYDSLQEKLLRLPDETEVWPAHGAGSLCGRKLSSESSSTIGQQRQFNYALQPMSKAEFVAMMTSDLPEVPQYFPRDAELNRTGAAPLAELPAPRALQAEEARKLLQLGAVALDVRSSAAFGTGHVRGAIHLGLGGQFASWAGTLLALETPLLLITESEADAAEARMRLARVGLEKVVGFLDGGVYAWDQAGLELGRLPQMPVDELKSRLDEPGHDLQLIDVRRPGEFQGGHVPGMKNLPLAELEKRWSQFDPTRPTAVICASGYRSSAATSLLARHGFQDLYNVVGGTAAWKGASYPLESE